MKNNNNELYFQLENSLRNAWDKYNFYMNTPITKNMSKEEELVLGEYTSRNLDIKLIPTKDNLIFVRLKEYQDVKEIVCSILSVLVKSSLNSVDSLVKLVLHLDSKYHKDSELHDIYQDCYLDSILPSIKIAYNYSFATILKMVIAIQDAPSITALSALHLEQSLVFSILLNKPLSTKLEQEELAEIAYYQQVDTKLLFNSLKQAFLIDYTKTLLFFYTNQDLIKYFLPSYDIEHVKYADILIDLVNYYELGYLKDQKVIDGLREIYLNCVKDFIDCKKPQFESELFWKITHCSNREFIDFLKIQKSEQFKHIALLSKLIVNNNQNTYSVTLQAKNIDENKQKFNSIVITKKTKPLLIKGNSNINEEINTLDYSDDDITVMEHINTSKCNDTQIENHLFASIRNQFDKIISKLKLNSAQNNNHLPMENIKNHYLFFNKIISDYKNISFSLSKELEISINTSFANDEEDRNNLLELLHELRQEETNCTGDISNHISDWNL